MGVHTVEDAPTSSKVITRRRELPRRRAIVGGFLVAMAAVGVFAAYRRAEAPPTTSFVVIRNDIAPGERLTSGDVALLPLHLPPAQAATAYTDVETVIGGIATSALYGDQLLVRGDLRESVGYTAAGEISFPVTASQALGGSLRPGELVDVVAAYGTGADAYTMTVITDALVISSGQPDGLGGSDELDVRLGVASSDDALAVAHAVTQAEMFLVRSPDTDPAIAVYRPPGGPAGTEAGSDAGTLGAEEPAGAGAGSAGAPDGR